MRKTIIGAVICALSMSAYGEETYDLKGWKLGSAYSTYETRAGFDCQPDPAPSTDKHCYNRGDTVAGIWPKTLLLTFSQDQLDAIIITIPSDDFDAVTGALAQRWGKPNKAEDHTVQNRMGASFTDTELEWSNSSGAIMARRFNHSVDESRILFVSRDAARRAAKKSKAAVAKRANDL